MLSELVIYITEVCEPQFEMTPLLIQFEAVLSAGGWTTRPPNACSNLDYSQIL